MIKVSGGYSEYLGHPMVKSLLEQTESKFIDSIEETCSASPEQYECFDKNGHQVAYLRLRWGEFSVCCPEALGTRILVGNPNGQCCFDNDEERVDYLKEAFENIEEYYNNIFDEENETFAREFMEFKASGNYESEHDFKIQFRWNYLKKLMERNYINVPFPADYEVMTYESPLTDKQIRTCINNHTVCLLEERLPDKIKNMRPRVYSVSRSLPSFDVERLNIHWNLMSIHGRFKKRLKFDIKMSSRNIMSQYQMFNKYAGRDDVICIYSHLRKADTDTICELKRQPYFLDRIPHYDGDETYYFVYCKLSKHPTKEFVDKIIKG